MDGAGRLRGVDMSMQDKGASWVKGENMEGAEPTRGKRGWCIWVSHGRCAEIPRGDVKSA